MHHSTSQSQSTDAKASIIVHYTQRSLQHVLRPWTKSCYFSVLPKRHSVVGQSSKYGMHQRGQLNAPTGTLPALMTDRSA